jgi:hypothetical protein
MQRHGARPNALAWFALGGIQGLPAICAELAAGRPSAEALSERVIGALRSAAACRHRIDAWLDLCSWLSSLAPDALIGAVHAMMRAG